MKDVKKSSPNTKLVFSSILIRKDKKDISKKVTDINSRLKNYCQQKHLDFIDNSNILEEHLGNRKLHLNKRGNSVLANNFMKYLRLSIWILDDFSCVRDFQGMMQIRVAKSKQFGTRYFAHYLLKLSLLIFLLKSPFGHCNLDSSNFMVMFSVTNHSVTNIQSG